jgi:hypothetical protein
MTYPAEEEAISFEWGLRTEKMKELGVLAEPYLTAEVTVVAPTPTPTMTPTPEATATLTPTPLPALVMCPEDLSTVERCCVNAEGGGVMCCSVDCDARTGECKLVNCTRW